jgi:hypothetical protein
MVWHDELDASTQIVPSKPVRFYQVVDDSQKPIIVTARLTWATLD